MSKRNNGGATFPLQHAVADANDNAFKLGQPGMTLRDYFAGQALAHLDSGIFRTDEYNKLAFRAYSIADAMLAERAKR